MKRNIKNLIIVCVMLFTIMLVGCSKECEHIYDDNCDTVCNECGEEREVNHKWLDATCNSPKTCTECKKTEGVALGHQPNEDDGDCTTALLCSVCDRIAIEAKEGHVDKDVDGICDNCLSKLDYFFDSENQVYYIYTLNGLYKWNAEYYNYNTKLMNDIVMLKEMNYDLNNDGANDSNWRPVSISIEFDGNGHSITGLVIDNEEGHVGFFSNTSSESLVYNLSLIDINYKGYGHIGGIAGSVSGKVINCTVSGNIVGSITNIGGIAGSSFSELIAFCHSSVNIKSETESSGMIGGIVGQYNSESGKIVGCSNSGTITSTGPQVGGIVGTIFNGQIIASYNSGFVKGAFHDGAIAGYIDGDDPVHTYWTTYDDAIQVGVGNDDSAEKCAKVDNENITWEQAMINMNKELSTRGYQYKFVLNTSEDKDIRPLIIEEIIG